MWHLITGLYFWALIPKGLSFKLQASAIRQHGIARPRLLAVDDLKSLKARLSLPREILSPNHYFHSHLNDEALERWIPSLSAKKVKACGGSSVKIMLKVWI